MKRCAILISIGVTLSLSMAVRAEEEAPANVVTFGLGPVNPARGSRHAFPSDAVQGNAAYYRRFTNWFETGVEAGCLIGSEFDQAFPDGTIPDIDGDGIPDALRWNSTLFSFALNLTPQIRLGPQFKTGSIRWNPYITGGGGLYWIFYTGGTFQITGVTSSGQVLTNQSATSSSRGRMHGGFNAGPGLTIWFRNGWGLGGEIRYHQVLYKRSRDASIWIPAFRISREF